MLRERTRSHLKDQQKGHLTLTMADSESLGLNHKANSFFTAPALFVGLSPKGISDCDSVRSPTSPLDFRAFSNLGNSYRSQRSKLFGNHNSWDSSKVGLSILNSLDVDVKEAGKVLRSPASKNICLGQKVRTKAPNFQSNNGTNSFEAPKSLPRNFAISPHNNQIKPPLKGSSNVVFEIGEAPFEPDYFRKIRSCSLDSCIDLNFTPNSAGSASALVGGLSASEIELSEDYTCVISHGPNPKKTHIYGDCILGCEEKEPKIIPQPNAETPFPSDDFLKICYYCHKKLDCSKDIYIYRGEKAFCSLSCRSEEIMNDEEMEKRAVNINPFDGCKVPENSVFFAP